MVIRVVEFDNDSNSSYAFDLMLEDLVLFTDHNMKVLEPENSHDLCHMILNNLTLVKRKLGGLHGGDSHHSGMDGDSMSGGEDELLDEEYRQGTLTHMPSNVLQALIPQGENLNNPTMVSP